MTITDEGEVTEKFIEDVLVNDLWTIEKGLKLIKRQKKTKFGNIDILARDRHDRYVIIEIKKHDGKDSSVGQVLGYMAALKEELKIPRKKIRGIIFCEKATERVKVACKMVLNLQIVEYDAINERVENTHTFMCVTYAEQNLIQDFRKKRVLRHIDELHGRRTIELDY